MCAERGNIHLVFNLGRQAEGAPGQPALRPLLWAKPFHEPQRAFSRGSCSIGAAGRIDSMRYPMPIRPEVTGERSGDRGGHKLSP